MNKKSQSGRSLLEMLGTLTIMGIITMVGLAAFNRAMNSHHANTILYEVNQRVHACVLELDLMNREKCLLAEYPDKIEGKYPVSVEKVNADFFKIKVGEVEKNICTQIKTKGFSLAGKIEPETCANLNQMVFVFNTDLNGKECQKDSDCTVCGHCVEGSCAQVCETPEPDDDKNCGKNECVVYDEETNSCQYQCVQKEWLESTGKQWIDTGYVATENTRILAKLYTDVASNRNWFGGAVSGSGSSAYGFCFNAMNRSNIEYVFGDSGWRSISAQGQQVVGADFTVDFSKDGVIINDTLIEIPSYTTFTARTANLFLFVRSNGASRISGKMYYNKIWDNGVLVRNFIPVLSPEGEACLFDKVSQKLFCNAGSGEFKTN